MRPYFQHMSPIGKALSDKDKEQGEANAREIWAVDQAIAEAMGHRKKTGLPAEKLHKRGEKTAWERIDILVDEGTFLPLNTLYDPEFNQEGTTGVVTGRLNLREQPSTSSGSRILLTMDKGSTVTTFVPSPSTLTTQASSSLPLMRIPQVPHDAWWHEWRSISVESSSRRMSCKATNTVVSSSHGTVKVSK